MNFDRDNEMFQLAAELINQTSRNIFLTGKAGTGKTTFLKHVREHCPKQMVVVAPTGVAAINAGGVTIHSFFQLPLTPYLPESAGFNVNGKTINRHDLVSRLRINKEKRDVFEKLELLIVDEVSMVSASVMDAMDAVLRYTRKRPMERFGGVQLLMIGDMFQLPPVRRDDIWSLMKEYYDSNYFFDSKVLQEERPLYIEFTKIYRQQDEQFISLLNQVRNNELDKEGTSILESRFKPHLAREEAEGYIVLTTHNQSARDINAKELELIKHPVRCYSAAIESEFAESAYPADKELLLKPGAQVMFIRNDSEKEKRFYNGKIGVISKLEDERIWVECKGEAQLIEVRKEKWENIKYNLNPTTKQMDTEVVGSFMQYPLRLAWAITIHKSQGLTFEKAVIDAGRAFEAGQVYVALSRCTSLDGIVLQTRITTNGLPVDKRITGFSDFCKNAQEIRRDLQLAKREYKERMIISCFDIGDIIDKASSTGRYIQEHTSSFTEGATGWIKERIREMNELQAGAFVFHKWIREVFAIEELPMQHPVVQKRMTEAVAAFDKKLNMFIGVWKSVTVQTDSRPDAREMNGQIRELLLDLSFKSFLLQGLATFSDIETWLRRKTAFNAPQFEIETYSGASGQINNAEHSGLYSELKRLRDSICEQEDIPVYMVAGSNTINEICRYLPQTLSELRRITGFGEAKVKKYGVDFIDIINRYAEENDLGSLMHEMPSKTVRKEKHAASSKKGDTFTETLRLYKTGKKVKEIADLRNLAASTIESHLTRFIRSGEIEITELIGEEKLAMIKSAVEGFGGGSITPIKLKAGDDVSFNEVRWVMASLGIDNLKST